MSRDMHILICMWHKPFVRRYPCLSWTLYIWRPHCTLHQYYRNPGVNDKKCVDLSQTPKMSRVLGHISVCCGNERAIHTISFIWIMHVRPAVVDIFASFFCTHRFCYANRGQFIPRLLTWPRYAAEILLWGFKWFLKIFWCITFKTWNLNGL